eukprot:5222161-Amphidinium_carterae.2
MESCALWQDNRFDAASIKGILGRRCIEGNLECAQFTIIDCTRSPSGFSKTCASSTSLLVKDSDPGHEVLMDVNGGSVRLATIHLRILHDDPLHLSTLLRLCLLYLAAIGDSLRRCKKTG